MRLIHKPLVVTIFTILIVAILGDCTPVRPRHRPPVNPDRRDRLFIIRALGNRCVDAGEPERITEQSPVVIRACRNTPAQRFRVQEIAEAAPVSHDFNLMIPGTPFCLGVSGNAVSAGRPLEVQTCTGSSRQRFAFDGDALLVGVQSNGVRVSRDFAIEPRDANTNEGTPVVAGTREFSDAEYWRLIASDGSGAPPTSGFVRVATYHEFDLALDRGWGTVIELAPPGDRLILERLWDLPNGIDTNGNNIIREGVTVRGGRKFLFNGVEISAPKSLFVETHNYALGVENHARVTGIRLRGPGERRPQEGGVAGDGILIQRNSGEALTNVVVDHVEASGWSENAIHVSGTRPLGVESAPIDPNLCVDRFHGKPIAKLVGNFLHHNIYSISIGSGGYAFATRNLFFRSRHDVTADGNATNRYIVHDSLFTSEFTDNEHMVDVHGTCSSEGSHWRGGRAGDAFDIGWNTFINRGRGLVDVRGTPCHQLSYHDNVTIRPASALETSLQPTSGPPCVASSGGPFVPGDHDTVIVTANNTFNYPDPTRSSDVGELGVGDFDGDGVDDVFLGTGATWWFSSGGKTEWRFLNRMTERAPALRFGDFDADGRTDIVRVHGRLIEVSWAGGSPWTRLSILPVTATVDDIAVGQFDGDPRADLFLADGTQWRWASAGAVWDFFAFSGFRVHQLRFGDFTHDGRTDVFGIESGKWRIVRAPGGHWQDLGAAQSTDIRLLVVADFDGDGIADVGRYAVSASQFIPPKWFVSKNGVNSFTLLRNAPIPQFLTALPIGRFDDVAGADVLFWDSLHFRIASGGRTTALWSRQSMR
jgi:hypothetical protein